MEQPKKRRGPKLNTPKQARSLLAKIIRQLSVGALDEKVAGQMVFAISQWLKAYELEDHPEPDKP